MVFFFSWTYVLPELLIIPRLWTSFVSESFWLENYFLDWPSSNPSRRQGLIVYPISHHFPKRGSPLGRRWEDTQILGPSKQMWVVREIEVKTQFDRDHVQSISANSKKFEPGYFFFDPGFPVLWIVPNSDYPHYAFFFYAGFRVFSMMPVQPSSQQVSHWQTLGVLKKTILYRR